MGDMFWAMLPVVFLVVGTIYVLRRASQAERRNK